MKHLILLFILFTSQGHASIERIMGDVTQEIAAMEKVRDPAEIYARDAELWTSIVATYDLMKSSNLTERYNFMYEAMRATSLGHPERIKALNSWLSKEDSRILSKKLPSTFNGKWKDHVQKIRTSIGRVAELPSARPPHTSFLSKLEGDLKRLTSVREENLRAEKKEKNLPLVILGTLSILGLLTTYLFRRKLFRSQEEASFNDDSIEAICNSVLMRNGNSLEDAKISLKPHLRSPFHTESDIPEEKVTEAVEWLVKGAALIAKSMKTPSQLEWKCSESSGRISLEMTLHGFESDFKRLYMNTVEHLENSAPAHFGRSEVALEGYLPAVMFRSSTNKTTISLSMDSRRSSFDQ